MFEHDALIIGCGLTGAVIARHLAEEGRRVLILERRNHIGGNMYDRVDEHGLLVQVYGPHIFKTNKKNLYDYIHRFEDWNESKVRLSVVVNGKCLPLPFNFKTIDEFYSHEDAAKLKRKLKAAFPGQKSATILELLDHSDPDIKGYADFLFENDYSLYTAKMWGIPPETIDKSVLRRVPVRFSYDEGYFDTEYEALPVHSFTRFFENLLAHENITVKLGVDALNHLQAEGSRIFFDGDPLTIPVVYTGALDELFGNVFGSLPYRSLSFEWEYSDDEAYPYTDSIVSFPQEHAYTRSTEYKSMLCQKSDGYIYAFEYPSDYVQGGGHDPYYPVLTEQSMKIYAQYRELAGKIPNLIVCGRLGDFKYYYMEQALERAIEISHQLQGEK